MLTGWISDADTAERGVRDGLADFAIMGRALIADSHLVEQYATGRKDEICPCVACGQGYVGNADNDNPHHLHPHPALGPGSLHARLGVANTHGIFAADGDYYAETLAHRVA